MTTPGVDPLTGAPVTPAISPQVTDAADASTIQGVDMQSLVVAFSLGILMNAASAAAFMMVKGRTTSIWKDGQRLVLAIFLISIALWANIDFIATLINQTSDSGCHVAVAFGSTFDQLARVALLQYFLWASAGSTQTAVQRFVPQGLLLARFILGGVFVGMQRPQFNPICVPTTQVMPVSIATIITDGVVFLVCLVRVFSAGGLRDAKEGSAGHQKAKGVRFTLAGFVLWMGTSIPMHLGTTTLPVVLRVALPAATATVLIAIIAAFCHTLPLSDARPLSFTPEAPSPRRLSTTRDLQSRDFQSRDLSSSDSDYPPSRYEDLKRDEIISITAFPKPPTRDGLGESPIDGTLPGILNAMPGQAVTGIGGFPVQGQLFPPMRAETAPAVRDLQPSEGRADLVRPKKGFFGKSAAGGAGAARLAISGPVLQAGGGAHNPLDKIPTVDLATAARNEKDRRDQANQSPEPAALIAMRPAPQPPVITREEAMRRAQSVRRKDIASTATPPESTPEPQVIGQEIRGEPVAITTSAELSPGADELRRRSPRALGNTRPAPQQDQGQGAPRRPPRPESLDIDVGTQVTKPAPQKLMTTGFPKAQPQPQPFGSISVTPIPAPPQAVAPPRIPSPPQMSSPARVASPPQISSPPQTTNQGPPPDTASNYSTVSSSSPKNPQQMPDPGMSNLPRKGSVKTDIRPSRRRPASVEEIPSPVKPAVKQRAGAGLPGNPRAVAMRQLEEEARSQRQQTVMFVNNIEYNDPVAVKNILDGAAKKAANNAQLPPSEDAGASVLHRPRPVPRHKRDEEEAATAQDYVESPTTKGHERTKSNGSASTRKSMFKSTPGSPSQLPPLPPPPKHPGNQIRPRPNNTKSMTFDEKMDIFFPVPPSGAGSNDNARSHFSPVPAVPAFRPSFMETDDESGKDKSDRTTKTSFQTQSVVEIIDSRRQLPMNMRNTAKFSIDTETTTAVSQAWLPPVPSLPNIKGLGYPAYEGAKRQSSPILPYPVDGMPMFVDSKTQDNGVTNIPKQDDQEIMTIMLDPSQVQRRNIAERESWMADGELAIERPPIAAGESKVGNHWHQRIGKECPTFTNRQEKRRSRKMVPPTPLLLRGAANKNMVIIRAAEPSPLESPSEAYQDIQAKLENLDRPNRDSTGTEARKDDLLANLEREMGMQEDHWHEMQNGLRDSISTLRTSPGRDSMYGPASRMAGQGPTNRGSLLKSNVVAQAQLRSPTPPYTDESDDDEVAARFVASQLKPKVKAPMNSSLWKPSIVPRLPITSVHVLWTPPQKPLDQTVGSVTLASLDMSRKTPARVINQPLDKLWSSSLWKNDKKRTPPSSYLWGSTAPIEGAKSFSRPLTQRPSRKSRRMTLLPDILESPQPLPDKRGTLGLYQFPWGEKSDTAFINTRPSRVSMAMPGTMTSGGPRAAAALDARSRQVETEEYSSSFFDDYEDEGPSEDDSDFDMDGSDEDFDETTLWEIASLLKTDKIPSKMSLLPSSSEIRDKTRGERSIIDDYMQGNRGDGREDSIIVALDTSILPELRQASLWVKPSRSGNTSLGLPQPDVRAWVRYIPVSETRARARPRQEEPALVESRSLWMPRKPTTRQYSLLWGPTVQGAAKMWAAPAWTQPKNVPGLFNPHHKRRDFRPAATINEPAALHTRRPSRPQVHTEALPVQVSSSMWSAEDSQPRGDINWIAAPIERRPHQPLRKQYRRPIASQADWEAALREAIEASYPKKTKPAFAAEQEWTAALNEALSLSRRNGNSSRRSARDDGLTTGLWSKPREVEHGLGGLWQHGRTRHAPVWTVSERTAAHKGRRTPEADRPLPVFLWQKMWRIQDMETKKPSKNWLDTKSLTKKFKGIQFRY